jgi:hypothetical protein
MRLCMVAGPLPAAAERRRWDSPPVTRPRLLPHESRRNVSGAIYGLILGASIISAASADHPGKAGLVEIYVCVTALVFYLAHVYARVIGTWIEGKPPSAPTIRRELREEWPMVSAQLLPALLLLLGALGTISGRAAITMALVAALAELMIGVLYACFEVRASTGQAVASVSTALAFAVVVVLLKIFVH